MVGGVIAKPQRSRTGGNYGGNLGGTESLKYLFFSKISENSIPPLATITVEIKD
jgi:hypothetical protein